MRKNLTIQTSSQDMHRTQRFDFSEALPSVEVTAAHDTMSVDNSSGDQQPLQSSNESELSGNQFEEEKQTPQEYEMPQEGFYQMVEYTSLQDDDLPDEFNTEQEDETSPEQYYDLSSGKKGDLHSEEMRQYQDSQISKLMMQGQERSPKSQATNESFSSPESNRDDTRGKQNADFQIVEMSDHLQKSSSLVQSGKTGGGSSKQRTPNSGGDLYSKVADMMPFREEPTEMMEYECQSSENENNALEQEELKQSQTSDQRAEQLRREDMLEYEIRRLEQLNLETAQRIKEPQTTDESNHEDDDFNLLEDIEQLPRRISNLEDNSPSGIVTENTERNGGNLPNNYTFEKDDDSDLNNRVTEKSQSPLQSRQQSRGSRKLYVIEEEASNLGGLSIGNTFRSRHTSMNREQQSERAYTTHDSRSFPNRNSDLHPKTKVTSFNEIGAHEMTRTQKYDKKESSLGSGSHLEQQFEQHSSPDFKKKGRSYTLQEESKALEHRKTYKSEAVQQKAYEYMQQDSDTKDNVPSYMRDENHSKKESKRSLAKQPFEVVSDESGNFDRISKILPGADTLYTEENEGDPTQPYNTLLSQLISENNSLKKRINDLSSRNSLSPRKKGKLVSVSVLAQPETREVFAQTVGPRSKAYYESIPARIDTGLNRRSDSEESFTNIKPYVLDPQKPKNERSQEKLGTPTKKKRKKFSQSLVKQGSSRPNSKPGSPELVKLAQVQTGPIAIEDTKSLRVQLQHVKNQMASMEIDNIQLQEKVAFFEAQDGGKDAQIKKLEAKLSAKKQTNQELQKAIDDLSVRIESVMADNQELKDQMETTNPSFSASFQNKQLQVEQQKSNQLSEKLKQIEASHEKRTLKLKRELSQLTMENNDFRKRLDEQLKDSERHQTKRSVEQFDFGTQTEYYSPRKDHGERAQANKDLQSPRVDNKSANVTVVSNLPPFSAQDQFSETQYAGEQGSNAEQEFIKVLVARANEYEIQSLKIEKEINEYKKIMTEAGQQATRHFRGGSTASNISSTVEILAKDPQHPVAYSQVTSPDQNQPPAIASDQKSFLHYKKKSRKLEKRNQKLMLERELNIRQIQDLQIRLHELGEKYRDMKQKLHFKLQEKSSKLNDLRSQLQQRTQIVPVQSVIEVDRGNRVERRTYNEGETSNRRRERGSREKSRYGERHSQRGYGEEYSRVLMGTISDDQRTEQSKVKTYQGANQQVLSARNSDFARAQPVGGFNQSTKNTFYNERSGVIDENVPDNKQDYFYQARPNNQSLVSNAGEIYSIISGLVDQKFAEKQQVEQRNSYQQQQVESGTYNLKQRHNHETFSPMQTISQPDEQVHLILDHSQKAHVRNPSDYFAEARRSEKDQKPNALPKFHARTYQESRYFERQSQSPPRGYTKAQYKPAKALRSKSERTSSQKPGDRSSCSKYSRDDVMPCYKAQFAHNPSTQKVVQPKPFVSEMLSQYLAHTQNSPNVHSSAASVLEAPRFHSTFSRNPNLERMVQQQSGTQQESSKGNITKILMGNSHLKDLVQR